MKVPTWLESFPHAVTLVFKEGNTKSHFYVPCFFTIVITGLIFFFQIIRH